MSVILYRLQLIRDELNDNKWKTWRYCEGSEMWGDLKRMIEELDRIMAELKCPT